MMSKKRYCITVTGRVQGVWYRGSARDKARQLNVKGFAKNEPDGSVYIEAEGDEQSLSAFLQWCNQGPPMAVVDDISFIEAEIKNFQYFDIK